MICGLAHRSSMLAELVKDRSLDDALAISADELAQRLGGLPERKMRRSLTCLEALERAIEGCRAR